MVITNDKIDVVFFCERYFFNGFYAAIQCNDQADTMFDRILNAFKGNAVSFRIAVGNIVINLDRKSVV